MTQPTAAPATTAARYMNGLPMVGSTKMPPWGARNVQPNAMESPPASAEPMIQDGMTRSGSLCGKGNGSLRDEGQSHDIVYNAGLAVLCREFLFKEGGAQRNGNGRDHSSCHHSRHDFEVALGQLGCSEHIGCLVEWSRPCRWTSCRPAPCPAQSCWRRHAVQEMGQSVINHSHVRIDEGGDNGCQENPDNRIQKHWFDSFQGLGKL